MSVGYVVFLHGQPDTLIWYFESFGDVKALEPILLYINAATNRSRRFVLSPRVHINLRVSNTGAMVPASDAALMQSLKTLVEGADGSPSYADVVKRFIEMGKLTQR